MSDSPDTPEINWTRIQNVFDSGPLVGPTLEPCYIEREHSPVEAMALTLRPDRLPQKLLFSGQQGSGKTSALVRLAHRLSSDYLVVWIDLHASMDLWQFSILDLLLAIGGGAYKVAHQAGLEVDARPWQDIVGALSTLVAEVLKEPGYHLDSDGLLNNLICAVGDPDTPLDLATDMPTQRFSLGLSQVRLEPLRVGTVLRELVGRVNTILVEVQARAGRPTLLIVDGMDKMDMPVVKEVFEYGTALADLRSRTLYTIPYAFYRTFTFAGQEQFDLRELPNIKLHSRGHSDQRHEPGYAFMRQVMAARLALLGLNVEDIIDDPALDALIQGSGGVLRGLMRLFKVAVDKTELAQLARITLRQAELALFEDQKSRSALLELGGRAEFLRAFDKSGEWEKDEGTFLNVLKEGHIIVYEDERRVWYAIHPLTRRALAALKEDDDAYKDVEG